MADIAWGDLPFMMQIFDEVLKDQPDYPDQIGTVRCCGIPVVMRNGQLIECLKCKRFIVLREGLWHKVETDAR